MSERILPGGGIVDDLRRPEDMEAPLFVVGTDRFMSGWGKAPGVSYFAVPCYPGEADTVERAMRRRSDMIRVRLVSAADYRPKLREGDHLSIRDRSDCSRFFEANGFGE